MKYLFFAVIFLVRSQNIHAQSGTADLMAGHEYLHYQQSLTYEFKQYSGVGWQHLATMIKSYQQDKKSPVQKDEIMNQVYLTARISKSLLIKGGLFYTNTVGYRPSIGLQYGIRKNNWMMVISPRADLVKKGAFEMFLATEFRPPLRKNIRLYSRIQAMSSVSLKQHNRSYQLIRLGIETKTIQLGAGLTFDEYGRNKTLQYNSGIFVRKVF
ncbi:MAG TPA: hypothetical protein VK166_20515 [Chitinophagaceae bacterium]|nr:hypothetical protein [Chitinophagaceae bacterium]